MNKKEQGNALIIILLVIIFSGLIYAVIQLDDIDNAKLQIIDEIKMTCKKTTFVTIVSGGGVGLVYDCTDMPA